jgi:hypothetical protein
MYEVLAPKVLYFPNAFSEPDKFIAALGSTDDWGDWKPDDYSVDGLIYGKVKEFRSDEYRYIDSMPEKFRVRYIVNSIKSANLTCGLSYLRHNSASEAEIVRFKRSVLTDKIVMGIKKYNEKGIPLGPHPDSDIDSVASEFSITFYPNSNYVGGELGFPDLGIKLKPASGSVVVYPSEYIHESHFVEQGEKFVTNYVYQPREPLWT